MANRTNKKKRNHARLRGEAHGEQAVMPRDWPEDRWERREYDQGHRIGAGRKLKEIRQSGRRCGPDGREHDWSGPVEYLERGESVTCAHCGESAIAYDMRGDCATFYGI